MTWNDLLAANRAAQANAAARGPSPWQASVFSWLKVLANLQRGAAARDMVDSMLQAFGYRTGAGQITQSIVAKERVIKVKLSMAWSGTNSFKFQQIEDDPYDYLAMLGLEPADASFWLCPKALAFQNAAGQHRTDSRWIEMTATQVPGWLAGFGGNISTAKATCLAQLGPPP